MKNGKLLMLIVVMMTAFLSCQDSETIPGPSLESRPAPNKGNSLFPPKVLHWFSGTYHAVYIDGVKTRDVVCTGIGGCGPFLLSSDENGGTPVEITISTTTTLDAKILAPHISLEEVIGEMAGLNSDTSAEELYTIVKNNVIFNAPVAFDQEISEVLMGNSNVIKILPGTYPIDYSNSEYGTFTLDISIEE